MSIARATNMPIIYIIFGAVLMFWLTPQPSKMQCPEAYIEPVYPILPPDTHAEEDPRKIAFFQDCLHYIQDNDECEKIWSK